MRYFDLQLQSILYPPDSILLQSGRYRSDHEDRCVGRSPVVRCRIPKKFSHAAIV